MAKLPQISAKELAKILDKLGFKFIRQEGSHTLFKHSDGRMTVVPNHPGENIGRGLLLKTSKMLFVYPMSFNSQKAKAFLIVLKNPSTPRALAQGS